MCYFLFLSFGCKSETAISTPIAGRIVPTSTIRLHPSALRDMYLALYMAVRKRSGGMAHIYASAMRSTWCICASAPEYHHNPHCKFQVRPPVKASSRKFKLKVVLGICNQSTLGRSQEFSRVDLQCIGPSLFKHWPIRTKSS